MGSRVWGLNCLKGCYIYGTILCRANSLKGVIEGTV